MIAKLKAEKIEAERAAEGPARRQGNRMRSFQDVAVWKVAKPLPGARADGRDHGRNHVGHGNGAEELDELKGNGQEGFLESVKNMVLDTLSTKMNEMAASSDARLQKLEERLNAASLPKDAQGPDESPANQIARNEKTNAIAIEALQLTMGALEVNLAKVQSDLKAQTEATKQVQEELKAKEAENAVLRKKLEDRLAAVSHLIRNHSNMATLKTSFKALKGTFAAQDSPGLSKAASAKASKNSLKTAGRRSDG